MSYLLTTAFMNSSTSWSYFSPRSRFCLRPMYSGSLRSVWNTQHSSLSDRRTEDCYIASKTDNTPLNTKYSSASDRCTEGRYVASETHNTSLNTQYSSASDRCTEGGYVASETHNTPLFQTDVYSGSLRTLFLTSAQRVVTQRLKERFHCFYAVSYTHLTLPTSVYV